MIRFGMMLGLCVPLAGCYSEVACILIPPTPVTAEVVDSVTGAPAAAGASGELRNATSTTAMRPISDRDLQAVEIRTGVFAMTISKTGYRDYEAVVQVRELECGPESVQLHVRLVPSP